MCYLLLCENGKKVSLLSVKLPKDTSAAGRSSGLLGDKFIALEIGNDEQMLANNDHLMITESSVSLEEMLGKFIFSLANNKPAAGKSDDKKKI